MASALPSAGLKGGRVCRSKKDGEKKVSARASVFLWLKIEKERRTRGAEWKGKMKRCTEHDFELRDCAEIVSNLFPSPGQTAKPNAMPVTQLHDSVLFQHSNLYYIFPFLH